MDSSDSVICGGTINNAAFDGNSASGMVDAWIAKYDSSGAQTYITQFGTASDDYLNALAVDSSDDIYCGGYTEGAFSGFTNDGALKDAWFGKFLNSSGAQSWLEQFGSNGADDLQGLAVDSRGYVSVGGYTDGILVEGRARG